MTQSITKLLQLLTISIFLFSCSTKDKNIEHATDKNLLSFYKKLPERLEFDSLYPLLDKYTNILIQNTNLDELSGEKINGLFEEINQKDEIDLPMYSRAVRPPFKIKNFVKLMEEYETITANSDSDFALIIQNFKKVKDVGELSPKITSKFFLDTYKNEMWEEKKYRDIGYLIFFSFTTINYDIPLELPPF